MVWREWLVGEGDVVRAVRGLVRGEKVIRPRLTLAASSVFAPVRPPAGERVA